MIKLRINAIFTVLLLILVLTLAGCSQALSQADGRDISVEQALKDWQNKSAIILDVRTSAEYAAGHIPGAKLIPLDELPKRINEVPTDTKVYVICRSGNRSNQAVGLLREKGYSNTYNILSGMNAWKGPIEK